MSQRHHHPYSLKELLLYFLILGSRGFGGPVVLAEHMQNDLVKKRKWYREEDFLEGLAFAKLSPGPMAPQLAMYLGWLRSGTLGATGVGFALITPAYLMVVTLAALYLKYGSLPWIQSVLYSISAAVIGIMAKSTIPLTKNTLGRDKLLWAIFGVTAFLTVWNDSENLWIMLLGGILTLLIKAPPRFIQSRLSMSLLPVPAVLLVGMNGPASPKILPGLCLYFAKIGAVVFGSGLAIVPFLHSGVVDQFGWLNERQFLDAISVGMMTPGPIVISAAFIGYMVAGVLGSIAATAGIFLPIYLFVVLFSKYYRKLAKNAQIKAFVLGLTASAIGGIAGGAFILGRRALVDLPTVLIALGALSCLVLPRKVPEPVIILIAGTIGLFL